MLAGMGGMGAPNPRYLGAPIGWPGPAYREVPRRNSVGPLSRGYGCTVASVSCRSAGRCGPGAPSRSRSRVQEQLRDARRGSRWRPQCRGGVCSPRKREGPGLRPPFGLVAGKLPGAARPDPLLGNGAAGGGAGDHPGRATPLLASPPAPPPPSACPRGGGGREGEPGEAMRWPNVSQERPMLRKGICWPTQPRPKDCFSQLSASILSPFSPLSPLRPVISLKCESDDSCKTQSPLGAQGPAGSKQSSLP